MFGVDLSRGMLRHGAEKIEKKKLNGRVRLVESDVLELPFRSESFDAVTIAFGLRNLPDYRKGVAEMARVLKPGDDILYPEAIEILVNEVTILPKNTIVYSNWELIDEKNNELRSFSESNYNKLGNFEFNVRLLDGQQINVNTTLIPSNLFREDCIFRTLDDTTAIDYDFFLRAGILHGINFHLIEKTLLQYRVHSQQLSHKGIAKTLSYLSEVRNQVLSQTDESTRKKYLNSLDEYKKKKSFSAKTKNFCPR